MSGETCLSYALSPFCVDLKIVELLLKSGAKISQISPSNGVTALHIVCTRDRSYSILEKEEICTQCLRIMLKYGADLNVLDHRGATPLQGNLEVNGSIKIRKKLIKELAKLKFENRYICQENLKCLQQNEKDLKYFKNCLNELQKMKDTHVQNGLTLYDILTMENRFNKLISLAKNRNLVESYEIFKIRCLFPYFIEDLDYIVEKPLKIRSILQLEEKKLYPIFKDYLPELVIEKIVHFSTEELRNKCR